MRTPTSAKPQARAKPPADRLLQWQGPRALATLLVLLSVLLGGPALAQETPAAPAADANAVLVGRTLCVSPFGFEEAFAADAGIDSARLEPRLFDELRTQLLLSGVEFRELADCGRREALVVLELAAEPAEGGGWAFRAALRLDDLAVPSSPLSHGIWLTEPHQGMVAEPGAALEQALLEAVGELVGQLAAAWRAANP